jgi:hypothetical protein
MSDNWDIPVQVFDHDAAITAAFAAVVLWLVRWRAQRDEEKKLMLRTLADAVPVRPRAQTQPLPVLRLPRAL